MTHFVSVLLERARTHTWGVSTPTLTLTRAHAYAYAHGNLFQSYCASLPNYFIRSPRVCQTRAALGDRLAGVRVVQVR